MFSLPLFWDWVIPRAMVMSPQNNAPQILVIGAGLIGLSTADALQQRGAEVTVIEARSKPMNGTSYSNSGMAHPSQARPWPGVVSEALASAIFGSETPDWDEAAKSVLELAHFSQGLLRKNIKDLDLFSSVSKEAGCFQIFDEGQAAYAAKSQYDALGIDAELMSDHEKTLGHLALYFPDDFGANAFDYGNALAARLTENGALFIYDAADLRLRMGHNVDGVSRVTAQLRGHIFRADHIVVCAGPQSEDVLSQLSIDLPLINKRGFAVNFDRPDMALPEAPLMDAKTHSALTVLGDTLRFSGTLNAQSANPLLTRWYELAPDIMRQLAPAREVWSGLRPVSPHGRPYIGAAPRHNLWVNTGHAHMGWTLCAGSGVLMAEMILDGLEDARFALPQ